MKSFANWLMKGRMQAVIGATVSAVLALLVTPLALFSAAVVMLTVLRQGWREGLLVVGSALLAIGGLGGLLFKMPVAFVLVGVSLWLPAAVLGGVMGRTGSLRAAIELAAFGGGLIVLLQYVSIADPAAFWAEMLRELVIQRLDEETLQTSQIGQVIELMAGWMVGGVAATWVLGSVASLSLARYWSALLDRRGAFGEEFRQLRFGRWWLLLVPVLFVAGVLLTGGKPSLVGQLYLVGMVVFLVHGISLVHGLVAVFGASPGWIVVMYLLLVFVAPQGAILVSIAGYADGWLDFRARARARRRGAGDE